MIFVGAVGDQTARWRTAVDEAQKLSLACDIKWNCEIVDRLDRSRHGAR